LEKTKTNRYNCKTSYQ